MNKKFDDHMRKNVVKNGSHLSSINDDNYEEDNDNDQAGLNNYEEEEEEYKEDPIDDKSNSGDNIQDDYNKNDDENLDNTANFNETSEMSFTGTLSGSISPMELLSAQLAIEKQKTGQLEKLLHEERERIANLEEMLHEELEKNDKFVETQANNEKTIEELKAQLDKVDNEKGIGLLREENSSLMDQIEELQAELNKKQKQQGTAKLESDLQRAKEQLTIKDSRIEQLNTKNKSIQKINEDLQRENELLTSQIEELHQKLEMTSKEPKPKILKGYQKGGQSRIPSIQKAAPEGYDPQRFGFKPRPTSAEDHIPHSKLPRFPGHPNKSRVSEEGEVNDDIETHQPILTKPTVKRPKLGQLKPLREKKPMPKPTDEEFVEDNVPIKMNKVDVSFDDDAIIEQDDSNKNDQQKIESPSVKKASNPPPRRALVDNIQFDDGSTNDNHEEKQNHNTPKSIPPPQPQPQPPMPNKVALQSHITFDDSDQQANSNAPPPIKLSGLSANEIRAKVDQLNQEKAEIERQLNKALPKGKIMMHVRREREEMEEKLDGVVKDISKLKLELHFVEKK